ncbi:MAG TPA: hypothetical protein DCS19_12180 [Flavobacterium sp.]|jgi:hypothetical protein|nr:hypothetical protein [Flavobacterium sp.]
MKDFLNSVVTTAEKYRELPDKFIDTNMVLLAQIIICLTIGVSVVYLQNLIVHSCILPILEIKK